MSFTVLEKNVFTETRIKLVLGLSPPSSSNNTSDNEGGSGLPKSKREKIRKIRLGKIFTWCNRNSMNIIEDYAIGQPTLEQVFLKFAKQQEELEIEEDAGNP